MVLRLLSAGEARLIRLCLYAIPVIFCIIFYSFLLGNKVLSYFENYMQESYVGVMGELTINSPSSAYINALYVDSLKAGFQVSQKLTHKSLFALQSKHLSLVKGFQVYVYKSDYLKSKFDLTADLDNTLIISSIVAKQLALQEHSVPLFLSDPHINNKLEIKQLKVVDLGFLTSEPIIMLSAKQYQQLQGKAVNFQQLEFHQLPPFAKRQIENLAQSRFLQGQYSSYKIIDTKNLSREHEAVFNALHWLAYIIFATLVMLNLLLSVLAVKTLLSAKKSAIHTLQLLGMTWQELWSYILFAWIVLLLSSYLICSFLTQLTEQQVIQFIF